MHPWIAVVVVLLLHICVTSATPDRTNDYRNQSPGVRPRRHDTEERPSSGRRWTTSRNSPYQKIVSSYEQEAPEGGRDDADQAKAKSSKRKSLRTSALSHDQIASETSAVGGNEKVDSDINATGTEDSEGDKKSTTLMSRRRSSVGFSRDLSSEHTVEPSTVNPKKRRRIVTTTSTSTLAPQTMSDTLYQYFRPLDRDVPQDDIIPFLDFGRKLSPVIPTPSGANSIDSKSVVTKLKPRNQHEEESHSTDEELLQEDMDVTVVKKAIERNSVPRAKLRIREQGISDYYRKRGPAQIRTTENLISTSDSSTAPPMPNAKNVLVLKKINRHQIHTQPFKNFEEQFSDQLSSAENTHSEKNVEVLQDKRRQYVRPIQRLAAIKQESSHSPLTAESTLVKTIIKEVPHEEIEIENRESITENKEIGTNNSNSNNIKASLNIQDKTPHLTKEPTVNADQLTDSKVLSTAVVTSVSVQESLENPQMHSVTEHPNETKRSNGALNSLSGLIYNNTNNLSSVEMNSASQTNITEFIPYTPISSTSKSEFEIKTTTVKIEIPLRSRDIYKPKTIPPGSLIPHLPRVIPNSSQYGNSNNRTSPTLTKYTNERINKQNSTSTITTTSSRAPIPSSTMSTTKTPITSSTTSTTKTPVTTTTTSTRKTPITSSTKSTTETPITPSTTTTTIKSPYTNETLYKEATPVTPLLIPEIQPEQQNKELNSPTKEIFIHHNLDKQLSTVQATVQEITTPKEISNTKLETIPLQEGGETSSAKDTPHYTPNEKDTSLLHIHNGQEDRSSQSVEPESVPPPQNGESTEPIFIVPVFSPDDKIDPEDQYQVYFTIPPTSTIPVVDTRPDAEAEVVEEKNLTLIIPTSTRQPAVDWVKLGAVEKEVEVVYPEPMSLAAYMLAALGVVPVLIGALVGARFLMAHNKKKVLDESEYSSEYNRSPLGITNTPLPTKLPRIPTHVSWNETEKSPLASGPAPGSTPSGRWEFPREKLRLQTLLGQGNFGQVWKAEADDITGHEGLTRLVAVKTVKECANAREREDLLRELGIMQELGSHPNVVTLLGCCTEKEPIYVLMEYVMFGKLLSFLRDHRTRAHYYNFSDATDALTSRDLTVFAYCVARGMDYLTNKSIIHRDLAARNVLVDHNKLCKIADFGMSRNVRDTGQIYEQRQSKGALPIRWMAPESLHFSLFTHKTDVWSFGILMWEIVTLGSTPYATMGAREVMRRVRDGYRLERPTHCHHELFRVIDRCWHSEPSKRPSFAELKTELAQLLSDSEHKGNFVDLDSYADQMRRDSLHRHM